MHIRFTHISLVLIIIQLGVIACAEEEDAQNWDVMGMNYYNSGGWTWAAGTVRQRTGWHGAEYQFSLEGDDTAAISSQLDWYPWSVDIVAEIDDGVSLKVVVEGYVFNCGTVMIESPNTFSHEQIPVEYWAAPASIDRVCPKEICGTSDEDGYCLLGQVQFPLHFSGDGAAHVSLIDEGYTQVPYWYYYKLDNVVVSIVKEGDGTALLERLYL